MPVYVDTTIGNFGEIKPYIASLYWYGGVVRWQYSDNGGSTWNEKPNNADHSVQNTFGGGDWGNLTLSNQWRNLSGVPQVTATATATLSGGSVSGVTITNAGSGYPPTSTVSVLFQPLPPGATGTRATGYATTNSSGQVSSVTRTNNGSGYGTSVPSVRISPSTAPITDINGGLPVDGRLWRVLVTAGLRSASSDYFDEGSQTWQGRSEEWNDTIVVTISQQPTLPAGDVIVGQEFTISASATAVGSEHGLSYTAKYRWQVSDIDPILTDQAWWTTLTGANSEGPSIDFRPPNSGDTWIRCIAYVSYSDTDNNRIVVGRPEAAAYSDAIYLDVLPAG
jgi:hypothetical protein